jgi:predicted Fe-S protein YdhL (DUF1289 family)
MPDERFVAGPEAMQSPVPSPCISVCRIDPTSGLCVGCLRSLDEIACWGALDDSARRDILRAVADRRAGYGSLRR